MGNAYGRVLATIWRDHEFVALGVEAQWLYLQLLSSEDRGLTGVVPLTPRRWQGAVYPPPTLEELSKALQRLSEARFVLIDEDTDELLIRTGVKYDPPRNPNVTIGMWRQWERVRSERLRAAIVAEIPAEVWLRAPLSIPLAAQIMRGENSPD